MPHNSPVAGSQSKPMVLRKPLAKIVRPFPSGSTRSIVACSGLLSLQALQEEPTLKYSIPSGPKANVRLGCCPLSGKSPASICIGPSVPSARIGARKSSLTVAR